MAEIKITIPTAKLTDFIDTMCEIHSYDNYVTQTEAEGKTPISKQDFVKKQIINYIKSRYRNHKLRKVEQTAREGFTGDINLT